MPNIEAPKGRPKVWAKCFHIFWKKQCGDLLHGLMFLQCPIGNLRQGGWLLEACPASDTRCCCHFHLPYKKISVVTSDFVKCFMIAQFAIWGQVDDWWKLVPLHTPGTAITSNPDWSVQTTRCQPGPMSIAIQKKHGQTLLMSSFIKLYCS